MPRAERAAYSCTLRIGHDAALLGMARDRHPMRKSHGTAASSAAVCHSARDRRLGVTSLVVSENACHAEAGTTRSGREHPTRIGSGYLLLCPEHRAIVLDRLGRRERRIVAVAVLLEELHRDAAEVVEKLRAACWHWHRKVCTLGCGQKELS